MTSMTDSGNFLIYIVALKESLRTGKMKIRLREVAALTFGLLAIGLSIYTVACTSSAKPIEIKNEEVPLGCLAEYVPHANSPKWVLTHILCEFDPND